MEKREAVEMRVSNEITRIAEEHRETWLTKPDPFWLGRLLREIGELGKAVGESNAIGTEKDRDEREATVNKQLSVVGSIVHNWLTLRIMENGNV